MSNQSPLVHPKLKDDKKKALKVYSKKNINEKIFDINKDKKAEANKNISNMANNAFNKTFTKNFRKPCHNFKKNLNLHLQNINNGINVNIILCVTKRRSKRINEDKEEQKIPKISPYTFKYFCNTANKNRFSKTLSTNAVIKNSKQNLESNFMKLTKDANIYTSNVEYIQNKKLLLFDKYIFENDKYKPNRANLFDMTSIPHSKKKMNTLYKTTYFRGGRMFFFQGKVNQIINEGNSNSNNNIFMNKKPIYIQDLEKYKIKTENDFFKINKEYKYIDNSYQNKKRHPPSNSLYKDLTSKKNEIYDAFINNKINETERAYSPLFKSHLPLSSSPKLEEKNYINKKNNSNKELAGYSNLLYKKKNDGVIPITFPLVCSNAVNCDSISQKKRFENIMETFMRLKSLIDNDKKLGKNNEIDYIIEFILNRKIDKKYISDEYIKNFLNFLKNTKLPIDPSKSLKENIILALNIKQKQHNKFNYQKNKNMYCTNNKIDKKEKNDDKKISIKNTGIFNCIPLEFDLKRQKQLFADKNYKNNIELRDALKKELDLIENEVGNKQSKIRLIENNLNLLPFEENYYFKKKMNKNTKLKKNKNKELLLISPQGYYKAIMPNIKINKKNENKEKENLFDSNERLYYSWYKNKNRGIIKNYVKKFKLTEYIIYNRTKDRIIKNKLKEIAERDKNK